MDPARANTFGDTVTFRLTFTLILTHGFSLMQSVADHANFVVRLLCSVVASREWITKLTGRQLTKQLSQRELETTGAKSELVERLNKYLDGKLL